MTNEETDDIEISVGSREWCEDQQNPVADAIAAAEEIFDPLDGLVERTAVDPGAPFAPDGP